ncbi:YicC/YloC family endoribonuclease [Roseicyclus mahoneyensis]|nr:YicC/YloC family endoribonuclease [Roseicyclus mahoneyensis]
MTGFAAREGTDGRGTTWGWELRSVNARGLDLRLRLPDGLGALEAPLRKRLSEVVSRGSVSLSLRVHRETGAVGHALDPARLTVVMTQLVQVRRAAEAQGLPIAPVNPATILSLRTLAETGETPPMPAPETLLADAEPLIAAFSEMRAEEGAALAQLLSAQIDHIEALIIEAAQIARDRAEPQAARLRAAVASLVEATDIDEARLLQEVAALALKTDVTEEIDRLHAHVAAARALVAQGGPVGRKFDFLTQELNREANTLCSKSQDAALTAIGLDLKLAIDQTREQVQNVE